MNKKAIFKYTKLAIFILLISITLIKTGIIAVKSQDKFQAPFTINQIPSTIKPSTTRTFNCQYLPLILKNFTSKTSNTHFIQPRFSTTNTQNQLNQPCSVLSINKIGPTQALRSTPITYNLIITNHFNISITNIIVTDVIPINAIYLQGGTLQNNKAVWHLDSLPPNGSITLDLVLSPTQQITQTIVNDTYAVSAENGQINVIGQNPVITAISNGSPSLIYVIDENGLPVTNTVIYRNAHQAVTPSGIIAIPNQQGVITTTALYYGEQLVAMKPVSEHIKYADWCGDPPIDEAENFAYRVYISSMPVTDNGEVKPYIVPGSDQVYTLTIKPENPLILFNLIASVEWNATESYLADLEEAFRRASAYLYDVTDGQMAFGWVSIYDEGENWSIADLRFSATNSARPYTYVGGLIYKNSSFSIHLGRFWDGNSARQGPWINPNGYRTLIHEFGHYALYLYDEYFFREVDEFGNILHEYTAACTSQSIRTNETDEINGSIMYYHYNASELIDTTYWNEDCQNTEQQRLNGKADWQTILQVYDGPDWVLHSPDTRGDIMAGPDNFPTQALPFPLINIHNNGSIDAYPRHITMLTPNNEPIFGATVTLYTTINGFNTQIGQGFTNETGEIDIYGAIISDIIKAQTLDGAYSGQMTIGEETDYIFYLTGANKTLANTQNTNTPYLQITPDSTGQLLYLTVTGLSQTVNPLQATVWSTDPTIQPTFTPLIYNPIQKLHRSITPLSTMGLGSGRILINTSDLESGIISDYSLALIKNASHNTLYAEDGNLSFYMPANSLAQATTLYGLILSTGYVPHPLPPNKQIIAKAYQISLAGGVVELEKNALLKLHYQPDLLESYTDIAIYRWSPLNKTWQALDGKISNPIENALFITTPKTGIYTLMGTKIETNTSN